MNPALRTWKAIDAFGQITVLALPYLLMQLHLNHAFHLPLIGQGGYITLGVWQLSSFMIHLGVRDEDWKSRRRRIYGLALAMLLLINLVFALAGLWFFNLLLLALVSPVLAILYGLISFSEWKTVSARLLHSSES